MCAGNCGGTCVECSSAVCLPRGPQGPGCEIVYYNTERQVGVPSDPALVATGTTYTVPVGTGIARYEIFYIVDSTIKKGGETQITGILTPNGGTAAEIDAATKRFHRNSETPDNDITYEDDITYFVSEVTMGDGDTFHIAAFSTGVGHLLERGVIKITKLVG